MGCAYCVVVGTYEGVLYGFEISHSQISKNEVSIKFSNKNHQGCIRSVTFCGNNCLASSSTDDTVCLYNVKQQTEIGNLSESKEYTKLVTLDNSLLCAIDHNGTLDIWDTNQWVIVYTLTDRICKNPVVLCSPHPYLSGLLLILSSATKSRIEILDLYAQQIVAHTCSFVNVTHIEWLPSGNCYLVVSNTGCDLSFAYLANKDSVFHYKFNHQIISDEYCFVGSKNGTISLVSPSKGIIYNWSAHDTRVKQLKMLKNVLIMVSVDSKGVIKFWNMIEFSSTTPKLVSEYVVPYRPTCMDSVEIY